MLLEPHPLPDRRPRAWGPGILVAGALLALAILPLLSPAPTPTSRMTVVLFAAAAFLALWKARTPATAPEELARQLDTLAGRHPRRLTIQLTHTTADTLGAAGRAYAATVVPPSGSEVLLAEAREPATVMAAARYWQRRLNARLAAGWGLSNEDIAAIERPPRIRVLPAEHVGPSQEGALGSVIALLCCAAALGLLVGSVATVRQNPSSPVSLVLLGVGAGLLVLLASATQTDRLRVSIEETVALERQCLGVSLGRLEVSADAIQFLRLVSPEGKRGRHLLLATRHGYGSVECQHDLGRIAERAISAADAARAG